MCQRFIGTVSGLGVPPRWSLHRLSALAHSRSFQARVPRVTRAARKHAGFAAWHTNFYKVGPAA